MAHRVPAALAAVILLAAVPCFAQGDEPDAAAVAAPEYVTVPLTALPPLKSQKAQFARLIAAPHHTTALTIILDESAGTGKGYDTLYADLNYDGCITTDERKQGQVNGVGEMAFGSFPAFAVADAAHPDEPAGQRARVSLSYQQYKGTSHFSVSTLARVAGASGEPGDTWQYRIDGQLATTASLETAPLTVLGGEPTLEIEAKPSAYDRHELGIGLTVKLGGKFCDPRGPQGSPDATIVVRNAAGELVKQATARLDQFCFG